MAIAMGAWADAQTAHGHAAVFSYEFAHPHSYVQGVRFSDLDPATAGAYHTSEVPFWLGTLDSFNRYRQTRAWTAADYALSDAMVHALVAFAQTGHPDTSTLRWPRYSPDHRYWLKIGATAEIAAWPEQDKFNFFRSK